MNFLEDAWILAVERLGQPIVLGLVGAAILAIAQLARRGLHRAWCFLRSRHRALAAVA